MAQNTRIVNQEAFEERESWHKLVVKVITWKSGTLGGNLKPTDKITPKEWKHYCSKKLEINVTNGKDVVMTQLKEIEKAIKANNGFSK